MHLYNLNISLILVYFKEMHNYSDVVDVYAVVVTAVIVKRLVMTLFLHCALSRRGSIHSLEA